MSAPRADETARGYTATERPATERPGRAPAAIPGIATLLLAGLALRLIIAYVLFPNSGFESDLGSFTGWALRMAEDGPGEFYRSGGFADYPPGYLYVLWLVGALAHVLSPSDPASVAGVLIKVPPILADLGVAYLIHRLARRGFSGRVASPRAATAAAALYLFNPVTLYDSALWGQVDAVGALVMLAAVGLLLAGYSEGALATTVLAGVVKPQFGVVLAPLVVAVLIRRHLLKPGSGPRPVRFGSALGGWLTEEQGWWRLASSAALGMLTFLLLVTPFGLGLFGTPGDPIDGFLEVVAKAAGEYPGLSINAYNPWAFASSGGRPSLAQCFCGWPSDESPFLGPLTAVGVGTLLLAGGFLLGLARVLWRDDPRSVILVAAYLSLAFFILPTRVHERYGFPAFAFLPLLSVGGRRWAVATLVLAAASFINLHAVLTVPLYGTPGLEGLALGESFRTFPWIALGVLGHTAVFGYLLWRLRPATATEASDQPLEGASARDEELRRSGPRVAPSGLAVERRADARRRSALPFGLPAWEEDAPLPRSLMRSDAESARDVMTRAVLPSIEGRDPSDRDWWETDRERGRPLLASLRSRLQARNVRADRSGALQSERFGRLERLDLFLLVLVVLGALTLRTWRVDQPHRFHFDEVYHARTGTEFLQHWRYGMPHVIYEYTHPHLAKYAMAAGIALLGNDRVTGESDLDVPVRSVAIERRWSPDEAPGVRNGDRLYVATGQEVRVYDLHERTETAILSAPADALALDEDGHVLFLADSSGRLSTLPTASLDRYRTSDPPASPPVPTALGSLETAPLRLAIVGDEPVLIGVLAGGIVESIDPTTGERTGRTSVAGAAAVAGAEGGERVVVGRGHTDDARALGTRLAKELDDDAGRIKELIAGGGDVTVASYITGDEGKAIRAAIEAGELEGVRIESGDAVAVAGEAGLTFLDAKLLSPIHEVELSGPATGVASVGGIDKPTLYVATGSRLEAVEADREALPEKKATVEMPNEIRDVTWDEPTNLVHALGRTQDGEADTVYVVEPHANAVFADARLPFAAQAWALDAQPSRPAADRQEILVFAGDGRLAAIDAGSHTFAWRFPGVLLGAFTAGCLYLLARILFRRRAVALIAAALVLLDGMFFAQSRIAMNDVYVAFFILAAYTLFAPLYLRMWRGPLAVGLGLPAVGLLLGLALASKWVGAYAIGGILLLVLLRSALGRLIALAGMVGLTALLGLLGIGAQDPAAHRNFVFLILMVALTALLAVAMVLRPFRLARDEHRFATIVPLLLGVPLLLFGLWRTATSAEASSVPRLASTGGGALIVVAVVVYLLPRIAAAFGSTVVAYGDAGAGEGEDGDDGDDGDDVTPPGWLRPGWRLGVPWLLALLALTVVPIAVYIVSYVPWVSLGNNWGPLAALPLFPDGTAGQSFVDLQRSMYEYHNELRAGHAASSPWWAWPLDLKPVWFYQDSSLANDTGALIYDTGNHVLFWLAIPAAAWAAWQAWRRRSLALTLVVIGLAAQWLPWARIDRATFQYHVYTSLPFSFMALAYFLAELWHGPSHRTWMLARVAAAVAILGAPLLWLARPVLCFVGDVRHGNENSGGFETACGAVRSEFVLTERAGLTLLVTALGVVALIVQLRALRQHGENEGAGTRGSVGIAALRSSPLGPLVVTVVGTLAALLFTQVAVRSERPLLAFPLGDVGPYALALLVLLALAVPALAALGARDSRRYVVAVLGAAALWLAVWYPNLAALPLPNAIVGMYQAFLPTYPYDFQFAVNKDEPVEVALFGFEGAALAAGVVLVVAAAMYAAYSWRSVVDPSRAGAPSGARARLR